MGFKIASWVIISFYIFIAFLYLIRLVVFAKHYGKVKKIKSIKKFTKELVFVLPMYKEQKLAKETFNFFLDIVKNKPNSKVIFVTTAKEKSSAKKPSTHDILKSCINEFNKDYVRLYNYPSEYGVMAHQVNYGIKMFYEENANKDFWVAIYNCDSRIFDCSLNEIYYNVEKASKDFVFQQYSYYYVPGKKGRSIPLSSAVWQTRWSIFKENAVARNKNKILDWNLKNKKFQSLIEPLSYCIGHGCIANVNTFIECGGMPEDTINEDFFMGYVFNCENKRIIPLYSLEKAESVGSTKALVSQQASWFNGPVDSIKYYKYYNNPNLCLFNRPICKKKDRFRAKILAIKGFNYAVHWMFSPVILLICLPILLCLAYSWWGLLIWLGVAEFYLFAINYVMYVYLKSQKIYIPHPSLIFDILFYFCHGLSAFVWLFKCIFKLNNINKKYKTER